MITKMTERPRRRALNRTLALLLVLGAAAGYFVLYPEALPEWAGRTPIGRELQSTTLYRWQDASGAWHASDRPPVAGIEYQAERYARDTNVLPLLTSPVMPTTPVMPASPVMPAQAGIQGRMR